MSEEPKKIASFTKRGISFLIDEIVVTTLFLMAFWGEISSNVYNEEILTKWMAAHISYLIFLRVIYQTFFIWYYGASVGKLACKIVCLNLNGEKPTFTESLIRASVRTLDYFIFYINFIVAFFNPMRQTLHDMLARTVVVDAN